MTQGVDPRRGHERSTPPPRAQNYENRLSLHVTKFVIPHRVTTIGRADAIVVMRDGRFAELLLAAGERD
jgi:ABC-type multidrug transport system fused ATPase/permease subunit